MSNGNGNGHSKGNGRCKDNGHGRTPYQLKSEFRQAVDSAADSLKQCSHKIDVLLDTTEGDSGKPAFAPKPQTAHKMLKLKSGIDETLRYILGWAQLEMDGVFDTDSSDTAEHAADQEIETDPGEPTIKTSMADLGAS